MASKGPTPFKLIFLFKKRPDMTQAQFNEHWSNVHGRTVTQFPVFQKHVRKYKRVWHVLFPYSFEDLTSHFKIDGNELFHYVLNSNIFSA